VGTGGYSKELEKEFLFIIIFLVIRKTSRQPVGQQYSKIPPTASASYYFFMYIVLLLPPFRM